MMRWQSEVVCSDRGIRVISVDIGPQIGAFSLRGCVRPESGGEKGVSAEGENIDPYFCHHQFMDQFIRHIHRKICRYQVLNIFAQYV